MAKETAQDPVTFQDIMIPVWANRKPIAAVTFIVTLLAIIVNYVFLPHYFKATASLLPETEKNKLSSLSQFADVAQIAGVNISGSEIARLYPAILTSETVLCNVINARYASRRSVDSVNLLVFLDYTEGTDEENMQKAIVTLRELMTTSYDSKTGIVSVTLEMQEPHLSADVLNAIVRELDSFIRHKRITNASEQLKWIEFRLKEVQGELKSSEEMLKSFREKNRRTLDSPELLMQQERLVREVQLKSTIFVELRKQYEIAKVEEIKNASIVNILDTARPPIKKERPQRVKNILVVALCSLVILSGYVAIRSMYGVKIRDLLQGVISASIHK